MIESIIIVGFIDNCRAATRYLIHMMSSIDIPVLYGKVRVKIHSDSYWLSKHSSLKKYIIHTIYSD